MALSVGATAGWAFVAARFLRRSDGIGPALLLVVMGLVLAALARSLVFPPDLNAARIIANLERVVLLISPWLLLLAFRGHRR